MRGVERTIDILRKNRASQAVAGVVRLPNDVIVIFELDEDADRPEDLLAHDPHVRRAVCEDRGLNEVPLITVTSTAGVARRAFGFPGLDIAHDALDERAN